MATKDTNLIYFVPDLFKCDNKQEFVSADDPFISEASLARYCGALEPSGRPQYIGSGIDTAASFPQTFWEDINKVHHERAKRIQAGEARKRAAEEEKNKAELVVKKQLDEKVERLLNHHKVYVKRSCPVKIPFKSTLSHDQHALYLAAFLKYQTRPPKTNLEHQEHQRYLQLQNQVFEEQTCFMNFSRRVAHLQLKDYNTVPPVVEEYVARHTRHGMKQVLRYPRLYHLEQEIPLRPQDPHGAFTGLTLQHTGHLLSLGTVPWLKLPYPNHRIQFPVDAAFLRQHPPEQCPQPRLRGYNLSDSNTDALQGTFLNKTPVSEDPNCLYLAGQHRASVVICPSALKILVDNPEPHFDKEWDIPVIIRTVTVTEADGSTSHQRVVFIDKPMKKKNWTPLEKKALYFKKAGLATLANYRRGALFRMKCPSIFHYCGARGVSDGSGGGDGDGRGGVLGSRAELTYEDSPFDLNNDSATDVDVFAEAPRKKPRREASQENKPGSSESVADKEECRSENLVKKRRENSEKPTEKRGGRRMVQYDDPFGVAENELSSSSAGEFGSQSDANLSSPQGTNSRGRKYIRSCNKRNTNKNNSSRNDLNNSTTGESFKQKEVSTGESGGSVVMGEDGGEGGSGCGGVLDDLLDRQSSMLRSSVSTARAKIKVLVTGRRVGDEATKDSRGDHEFPAPWTNRLTTDWGGHVHAMSCPPGTTVNYHYQLYKFHTGGPSHSHPTAPVPGPPSQNRVPPITVLVRHHLHGLSMENVGVKNKKFKSAAYVLFPKLENQVYFGSEVNTCTEISQQWAELLVRPSTSVLQARVCSSTGELLLAEERDLHEVLREGHQPHVGFNPATALPGVYATLQALQGMMPGQYLLHHPAKPEAFIKLMKSVDDDCGHQTIFDLHDSYGFKGSTHGMATATAVDVMKTRPYAVAPWLAIDTHVLTPFHLKHRKIPATFPMDNPDKKLSKTRKKQIKERAKSKKSIYQTMDEAKDDHDKTHDAENTY